MYFPIDVPDFHGPGPVISGLDINYAGGSRVPSAVRTVAPARQATAARVATPVAASPPALPFPPSLDRAFTADDTLPRLCAGPSGQAALAQVAVPLWPVPITGW